MKRNTPVWSGFPKCRTKFRIQRPWATYKLRQSIENPGENYKRSRAWSSLTTLRKAADTPPILTSLPLLVGKYAFRHIARWPMVETAQSRHGFQINVFESSSCLSCIPLPTGMPVPETPSTPSCVSQHLATQVGTGELHVADTPNCLFDRLASFANGEPQQRAVRVHSRVIREVENHAWDDTHLCTTLSDTWHTKDIKTCKGLGSVGRNISLTGVFASYLNATRVRELSQQRSGACVAAFQGARTQRLSQAHLSPSPWQTELWFSPSLDSIAASRTPGPLAPAASCLQLKSAPPVQSATDRPMRKTHANVSRRHLTIGYFSKVTRLRLSTSVPYFV